MRILIIDDEPAILESCKSILMPKNAQGMDDLKSMANDLFDENPMPVFSNLHDVDFDVEICNQGALGIEAVDLSVREKKPFAIALIDMRMPPGIDGLQTAERILAIDPYIEVVIVTAYSDVPLKEMIQRLGEHRFLLLRKPFDPDELRQMAQYLTFHWEVQHITRSYERFVPKEFLSFLNKDSITDVEIGDHIETDVCILFADIRAFTALSEKLTPSENFRFLNSYLGIMGPVIRKHNGVIDKFIGDAIMALFAGETNQALKGACEMLEVLKWYNEGRTRAGYNPINIGIGINKGNVMLGTLGEFQRMESSVVSDAVNVASRMEQMTKLYHVDMLISEHTYKAIEDPSTFYIRKIDHTKVPGREAKINIYEVFNSDSETNRDLKLEYTELFQQAISTFHDDKIEQSMPMFEVIYKKNPEDTVVRLYLKRIRNFNEFGIYEIVNDDV